MNEIAFYLKQQNDSDEAWQQLEEAGCQLLYSSEEPNGQQVIFGRLPDHHKDINILKLCPSINSFEAAPFDPIDWDAQWAEHGEDFHDGFVHIKLNAFDRNCFSVLKLEPGPGFGDLSHPTTRLVLTLMPDLVKNKYVVDIGCGSGILSLAALAMGAKEVVGVDIDVDALKHAYKNADINGFGGKIDLFLPEQCNNLTIDEDEEIVVLMNMIQSEQLVAWQSLKNIHKNVRTIITSGIILEGVDAYLKQCHRWNWQEINTIEDNGWLGFHFQA